MESGNRKRVREGSRPAIVYLVTGDRFFCSHPLPVAQAMRNAGFRVTVATRVSGYGDRIRGEGFDLVPLRLRRSGRNPWGEALSIAELVRLYRAEDPVLVHHMGVKPTLYGSLAARLAGVPVVVNALTGLGYVFATEELQARALRSLITAGLRTVVTGGGERWSPGQRRLLVLENEDDRDTLVNREAVHTDRVQLVPGSGVDTERFRPSRDRETEPAVPVVMAVSRMLRQKGIEDLVAAGRVLARRGVRVRVVLVGEPDPENPTSIPERRLLSWQARGLVQWWGFRTDVAAVLAQAHIAVLPSRGGEGLPKSLLEAAACGLPLIAGDVPGCRDIVRDDQTGILVPPGDADALADAISRLARDPALRAFMGKNARVLVKERYSEAIFVKRMTGLYRSLLGERWPEVSP